MKLLYLCDRKKCENCSYPECKHTTDTNHAVNYNQPGKQIYFKCETTSDDVLFVETEEDENGQ